MNTNIRKAAAFLTGYAIGYSLIMAGIRFTGLYALNHVMELGIPTGALLLGAYAAHLVTHSWQGGVAMGADNRKRAMIKKMVAEQEAQAAGYAALPPDQQRTLN